jgi:hypothetical protein
MEMVSQVALDDLEKAIDLVGLQRLRPDASQIPQILA